MTFLVCIWGEEVSLLRFWSVAMGGKATILAQLWVIGLRRIHLPVTCLRFGVLSSQMLFGRPHCINGLLINWVLSYLYLDVLSRLELCCVQALVPMGSKSLQNKILLVLIFARSLSVIFLFCHAYDLQADRRLDCSLLAIWWNSLEIGLVFVWTAAFAGLYVYGTKIIKPPICILYSVIVYNGTPIG